MAASLQGSSILAIAAQVRALVAQGHQICNLTIGDFDPKHYPLPDRLLQGTTDALREGHTNYPPANGIPELRKAVQHMYKARLGWEPKLENVLIAGGARPVLYGCYRAVVNPGEKVVYGTPSWNNNHYTHMVGGVPVEIQVGPEDNFFPPLAAITPHLRDAALVVLNSPLNPSGTCIDPATLAGLCDAILTENAARQSQGRRPLFLCYDQIYWMLTFGESRHADPVSLRPAMADYTVYVDGISKCFAATGLRVGWTVGPPPVVDAMNKVLGHVGAWAPKAEQMATARLLDDSASTDAYLAFIRGAAGARLTMLFQRLEHLRAQGYPVQALEPQGAIYLSAEFALEGWSSGKKVFHSAADVRTWLLEEVGLAMVPFRAFGAPHAPHWYRLSVGAVGETELSAMLDRLQAALGTLTRPA
ncbi:MAG: aminotransferase class I/II-fold pyridoxal phosphate-dependent enzyme [Deltaproteobacteria bacterium]|nr:aminotransferase class I/II-fold pyridoxal phosphate-dependent enzyme [Deltaproteobacteria bacterium]